MSDFLVYGLDRKKLLVRFQLTDESMYITTDSGLIICDISEAVDLRDWLTTELDANNT